MTKLNTQQEDRRKVIKLLGTSAAALPVIGLTGCGGGEETSSRTAAEVAADTAEVIKDTANDAAETASDVATDAADTIAQEVDSAMDTAEDVVGDVIDTLEDKAEDVLARVEDAVEGTKVDENSAQAVSLGYKHDASTVDGGAQPRYAAGQQCSNCAVFQGAGAQWGACPIFAGNLVKATGWCSAYVASS